MTTALDVRGLSAGVDGKQILEDLDLVVPFGEMHASDGPQRVGQVHSLPCPDGQGRLCGVRRGSSRGKRAFVPRGGRAGSTRPPAEFPVPNRGPGVALREFLLEAAEERGISEAEARERIDREAARFDVTRFLDRAVNNDLSGGEMKRSEIFQMAVLRPRVALLDEIDSGLDIDAVKQVAQAVEEMRSPDLGVLMITHYNRILRYVIRTESTS